MADCLTSRGPDAGGVWAEAASGAALGHQTMLSHDGSWVIVFNGEITTTKSCASN